jgi:cytochrome c
LTNGADPNAHFKTTTALHIASEHGWLDCVEALVKAGADVNALTHRGEPPIHLAKLNKHEDVAKFLLANGVVTPKPAPISAKLAAGDPEKGREAFNSHCYPCHFVERGKGRKIAPNLWGVVGRDKASLPEGGYSEALLAWEGAWTYEDLNTFLWGPKITRPGVFMYYPGVEDETERVNLIAYLRTLSENPIPLPAQ